MMIDFLSDVRQALSSWLYWSLGSMPLGGRVGRAAILVSGEIACFVTLRREVGNK